MANKKRDDFSASVKKTLAKRVGYMCSNPDCGCSTVGPSSGKNMVSIIGVASHICAAASGGPRYDDRMTSKQRSDISNGIWLCQNCSKLIDTDPNYYTVELLNSWKSISEEKAKNGISKRIINIQGRKTSGWMGYCNWSDRSTDEKTYIINETSYIFKNNFDDNNKKNLIDGINLIRQELLEAKCSVRLAGLSGTGKTRLAQVLFDETIGENPLNKALVIYGDVGDELQPNPIEFVQDLIKENKRAILIVDNCEPIMHNKLTKLCQVKESNVSLMTIEYDVKEDDNVDSSNYYLGPTNPVILKELLKRDYSYIKDSNLDTIVRYSEGNYRIAIYLAKAINKNKNIGVLNDNNLLERLFYQGKTKNEKMMKVGEVCSLFYSFNINYEDIDSNEISIISRISGLSPSDIIYYCEELKQKQIIQKRKNMCAVLPPALANRFASEYLNHNPINNIISIISNNNRLLKSFFRRIKNLHNNKQALKIAVDYLANLSDEDLINANDNQIEILRCINILHPSKILYRVKSVKKEDFFTRNNPNFYEWVLILSYAAYEAEYFQTAVRIIIKFALSEKPGNNTNSIRNVLSNLFHIYLSGTYAPLKDRLEIIDELINSDNTGEQELGLFLLDNVLEYGRSFIGTPMHDNGTKIRDYGLIPKPIDWFNEAFDFIDKVLDSGILYNEIREVVANNFVMLYRCGFGDMLDSLVRKNITNSNWPRIWVALLTIKRFDKDEIPEKYLNMINELIEIVKPSNTKEKLDTYLYSGRRTNLGLDIVYNDYDEVNKTVYELGREVGANKEKLKDNLLTINNNYDLFRIDFLAKGIYDETDDKKDLVYILLRIIDNCNDKAIKALLSYIIGFYSLDNKEECDKLLDKILKSKKYNKYFMALQLSYPLDDKSVNRIVNAIDKGLIDDNIIYRIESIVKELKTDQIIKLLNKIKGKTANGNVIIDTLYRISENKPLDKKLEKFSRENITELNFREYNENGHRMHTYNIHELIKKSFKDNEGKKEAKNIFEKIRDLSNEGNISYYDLRDILEPLINMYSHLFLDVFINYEGEPSYWIKHFFKGFCGLSDNIINHIKCDIVIEWIKKTKKDIELSYLLEPYKVGDDKNFVWNELAEYLFNNYSNILVVKNIVDNIYPTSWENDYSDVMKRRYNMILSLKESKDKEIKKIGYEKYEDYCFRLKLHLESEKQEREDGFGKFED